MNWISVKDRKPKKERNYLVSSAGYNINNEPSISRFYGGGFLFGVTHWMPLPKPPE